MGGFFDWQRLIDSAPKLLAHLPANFIIVFAAGLTGVVLGALIAVARIYKTPVLNQILGVFISFMRGTPMLVQMLVSYHAVPMLISAITGIDTRRWSKLLFAYITFALNQGAFLSEIIRSSILAIPAGQTEAGLASGLTGKDVFFRIVFPQAARIAIPALCFDIVGLFQETSLLYMVGVLDILGFAGAISARTGHVLECYIFISFAFIIISFVLRFAFRLLQTRLDRGYSSVTRGK